jgi:hypothetical protein
VMTFERLARYRGEGRAPPETEAARLTTNVDWAS